MHKSPNTLNVHRGDQYAELETFDPKKATLAELRERYAKLENDFRASYAADAADEDLANLAEISEDLEATGKELEAREAENHEKAERVKAAAEKLNKPAETEPAVEEEEPAVEVVEETTTETTVEEPVTPAGDEAAVEKETAPQYAAARRAARRNDVAERANNLPAVNTKKNLMFRTVGGNGGSAGDAVTFSDAVEVVTGRLDRFNSQAYAAAARSGRTLRDRSGVFSIRKEVAPELIVSGDSQSQTQKALQLAASETRLEGGSLVAAGGWCAPSEVTYDLLELAADAGIFSIPEIVIERGGITRTRGFNFANVFSQIAGFHYTEAQDQAGDYDGQGGGEKPCFSVDCPEFEEFRLELDGLCITAGLLQRRSYPELIEAVIRNALLAHRHRMAARTLATIAEKSTKVTAATVDGATANLLTAVELQVEHIRAANRMSPDVTLEAVFPMWTRGLIRSDLSKRSGIDGIDVTNEMIDRYFRLRGVNAQFVYNWQDANQVTASNFTGWGSNVQFLLYPAGTWVRGTSDIISLDTLFDAQNLKTNDYTALFVEEGSVVIPMGYDSRLVTVAVDPSGATGSNKSLSLAGVALEATPNGAGVFAEPQPAITPAPANGGVATDPVVGA